MTKHLITSCIFHDVGALAMREAVAAIGLCVQKKTRSLHEEISSSSDNTWRQQM